MEKQFFELLSKSNALEKTGKFLQDEDPEAFELLLKFLVTIEGNFHYLERNEYKNLARDFLDGQITADDFSYSFLAIYEGICKKITELKTEESIELTNFINKVDRSGLNRLLAKMYGSCDHFGLDPDSSMADEKELKDYAELLLLKLQQE